MLTSNIAQEICMEVVLCLHSEPDAFARSFETNARWYCLYIGFICMIVQIKKKRGTFCNFRKIISPKMLVWGKITGGLGILPAFVCVGTGRIWFGEFYQHERYKLITSMEGYSLYRHYREITYKCIQPSFSKKIGHYVKRI